MPRRLAVPGLALALCACGSAAQPANDTAPPARVEPGATGAAATPVTDTTTTAATAARESAWVDAGGGLSLRLELPAGPYRPGDRLTVRLHFRNDGAGPMRVYLIGSEPFRALQSSFYLRAADGRVLASQPEPHPHGYVVSEVDFPEIAAGATRSFEQTLYLDPRALAGQTGVRLRWAYNNDIERWQGGLQTLDGPTRSLFGGGPIPGIWRGKSAVDLDLPLAP